MKNILRIFTSLSVLAVFILSLSGTAEADIRYEYSLKSDTPTERGLRFTRPLNTFKKDIYAAKAPGPEAPAYRLPAKGDVDRSWIVLSSSGGVSRRHLGHSVRTTLREGSILLTGDHLFIPGGAEIKIALDETIDNALVIQGPADAEILSIRPVQVRINDGRAFFLIERGAHPSLAILTPHSIARGTGACFQADVSQGRTRLVVYQGSLRVEGRDRISGPPAFVFDRLSAGKTLEIDDDGILNGSSRPMSYPEKTALYPVSKRFYEESRRVLEVLPAREWDSLKRKEAKAVLAPGRGAVLNPHPAERAISQRRSINFNSGKYIY